MLPYALLLLLATPLFAKPDLEKAAEIDAKQTFQEIQQAATQLMDKALESPVRFSHDRDAIERPLEEYCDSMRKFPKILKECELLKKSIATSFNRHELALKKNGKPDKFGEAMDRIYSFSSRYQDLRRIQDDGNNIDPDILHRKRTNLRKEMLAFCPTVPESELAKSCASREKEYSNSLADHEEYIRTGAFNDPPPAKKVYRDTTPVLRCIPNLPKIRESSAEYKLSDPSGRYRYEHLTKTKFGFAINLKLSEITNQKLNNWKRFLKKFSDPRNGKTYTFEIAPQHSCGPGNNPDLNCSVSAISIRMEHNEGSVQKGQARAAFPIKIDSQFDLSLPIDEDEIEEFSLSCVIASKIRKGGWIFSDEFFE